MPAHKSDLTVLAVSAHVRCMRAFIVLILLMVTAPANAGTLEDVRSAGVLQCGVDNVVPEFSASQINGIWQGLPVEFCRALAFAVIGNSAKVNFTVLLPEERVEALQSGEVDVLVSALPISAAYESREGLLFSEPLFTNAKLTEHYAPAVRQGDDAWVVAVKWLRQLLVKGDSNTCATFDDVAYFTKNWGCEVFAKHGQIFARPAPN